jgi:hypothetical protein
MNWFRLRRTNLLNWLIQGDYSAVQRFSGSTVRTVNY